MAQSYNSLSKSAHPDFAPANRRDLLKGLSQTGLAIGAATMLSALPIAALPEPEQPQDHRALKYRETNHIRTFYDLARK